MAYNVGDSVKGIVTGITSFGAFVKLESGVTGMIHISKLSKSFVSDVASVVHIGDEVTATVIGVNGDKIALSLIGDGDKKRGDRRDGGGKPAPTDFESMLSSFKSASDERLAGLNSNNRSASHPRRRK